ncbi:MAG TPA: hypothetical protein VN428_23555 [Bryobacteraceae bacterium]|nr:hypothetical protein [Bryobacteraceae bacterium]
MFRSFGGVKAQYHHLTLLVISEFNEYKVLVYGPGVTIHGARQFAEPKAREHALTIARDYVRELKREDLPETLDVDWQPTATEDWLAWRN